MKYLEGENFPLEVSNGRGFGGELQRNTPKS
jgi:hypothetical protein